VKLATSEAIGLVQVGSTLDIPIRDFSLSLTEKFSNLTISPAPALPDPSEGYDSRRSQYHSTRILVLLERHLEVTGLNRVLGMTSLDLFVPGMNFVFGEARCPGKAGVVSTFRLRQFAEPSDEDRLVSRIRKEAVHEIGHMFGLQHCSDRSCVMYFSTTLTDTDMKSEDYCSSCHARFEAMTVK
jgi:archaemetzincin